MKNILFLTWLLLMAVAMQATIVTFTAAEWAQVKHLNNNDVVADYTLSDVLKPSQQHRLRR